MVGDAAPPDVAHELSGYSLCANSLLADSAVGLEALLYNLFGNAIAWYEDYAFLRGDGVGKPLGVPAGAAGVQLSWVFRLSVGFVARPRRCFSARARRTPPSD